LESILIHPKSIEQLKIVKAVLKALKVKFEVRSNVLPQHVLESIKEGIKQYENGQAISFEEFRERHFSKM